VVEWNVGCVVWRSRRNCFTVQAVCLWIYLTYLSVLFCTCTPAMGSPFVWITILLYISGKVILYSRARFWRSYHFYAIGKQSDITGDKRDLITQNSIGQSSTLFWLRSTKQNNIEYCLELIFYLQSYRSVCTSVNLDPRVGTCCGLLLY